MKQHIVYDLASHIHIIATKYICQTGYTLKRAYRVTQHSDCCPVITQQTPFSIITAKSAISCRPLWLLCRPVMEKLAWVIEMWDVGMKRARGLWKVVCWDSKYYFVDIDMINVKLTKGDESSIFTNLVQLSWIDLWQIYFLWIDPKFA